MKVRALCSFVVVLLAFASLTGCKRQTVMAKLGSGEDIPLQPWCLRRSQNGDKVQTQFFAPVSKMHWTTDRPVLVHVAHNKVPQCNEDSHYCRVSLRDRFTIEKSPMDRVFGYMRNPDFDDTRNEWSSLELSGNGAYLSGRVRWGDGRRGSVYIMFNGVAETCRYPNVGTDSPKPCKVYTVELYPDNVVGWGDYKPDGNGAVWRRGICEPAIEYQIIRPGEKQPGGGSGHEPPD